MSEETYSLAKTRQKVKSSAGSRFSHCKSHAKSLIEIENRIGSKFDPCGTPGEIVSGKVEKLL